MPAFFLQRALCALVLSGFLGLGPVVAQDAPRAPWFLDRTEASGIDFAHWNGMSGRLYYLEIVGAGGALFDYDGDGDLDLFLVQGALLGPDRTFDDATIPWRGAGPPRDTLWRNESTADGLQFVDVTEASGIDSRSYGMGAVAGDIDNDGDVDLYLLNFGANQLWRNEGGGQFVDATEAAGLTEPRWSVSGSLADYDNDGDLDLYVVNYLDYSFIGHKSCLTERGEPDYCLPSAYSPVADGLYRNRGDGTFEDVSQAAGISSAPGNGLGVISADFDSNGAVDFYVANDLMANNLWLNQKDGTFVDEGLLSGVALNRLGEAEASMGIAAGDPDADGDLDLFVTHFRRESNTYYRQRRSLEWVDATDSVELGAPSWLFTAFGTAFIDFDLDGWLDLVSANGAVTFVPGADRSASALPLDETNQLFRNRGDGQFEEVTQALGGRAFEVSGISRGALHGDLDNDGDTDLVITGNSGPVQVLLNTNISAPSRAWVGVHPVIRTGAGSKRTALGAQVESTWGQRTLVRRVQRDGGYATSSDPRVVLPVAAGAERASIVVIWPNGQRETFTDLEPGRYHELVMAETP